MYWDYCIDHDDLITSSGKEESKDSPKKCSVHILKLFMRFASLKQSFLEHTHKFVFFNADCQTVSIL